MAHYLCTACGTRFPPTEAPPPVCPICTDERQYVPAGGQRWTTLEAFVAGHTNTWRQYEPDLLALGTVPAFAINQRAFLLRTPEGNVLWDCISLLDDATISLIQGLGGIRAIAISHPHYYSNMAEWADRFGAELWLHEADRAHVVLPTPRLRFWSGASHALLPGISLINAPGHFDGGAMLHWQGGAEGRGVLLTGDILQVMPDRSVSVMRSYPNLIPLPPRSVRAIAASVAPYRYERLYGAFWSREILANGQEAVAHGLARYLRWVQDEA
jgi:hypothetical protein